MKQDRYWYAGWLVFTGVVLLFVADFSSPSQMAVENGAFAVTALICKKRFLRQKTYV